MVSSFLVVMATHCHNYLEALKRIQNIDPRLSHAVAAVQMQAIAANAIVTATENYPWT